MFYSKDNLAHIAGDELENMIETNLLNIIDVREKYELDICSCPGARHIPFNTLLRTYQELLDKDTIYYILCHTGQRSHYITKFLTQEGYNAINVLGGIRIMKKHYVRY